MLQIVWIVRAQGCRGIYLPLVCSFFEEGYCVVASSGHGVVAAVAVVTRLWQGLWQHSGPQQQPPQHRVNFLVLGPATPARTALCSTDTGCGQGLRITGIYFAGPRTEPRLCPHHQDTPHPAVIYLTTIMNNYEHPHTLEHLLLVQ